MDNAPAGSGPGVRNPGHLPGASKHTILLQNLARSTPGSQNLFDAVKFLVRSLCRVSAREVPWVGLGRRAGPPHPKTEICSTSSHTTPQGTIIHLVRYEVWLGAYDEFQPMGWPGWAWGGMCEVWWEVDNARGSRPPEGGFAKTINVGRI